MEEIVEKKEKDPLIPFLQSPEMFLPHFRHVPNDILTRGYAIVSSLITEDECQQALDLMWDFVQDVSGNVVQKDDPKSWYPVGSLNPIEIPNNATSTQSHIPKAQDPLPHTGYTYNLFPDMFQSLGAGYLLGPIRQLMAERLFEHLFGRKELHASKEGFTFARPTQLSIQNQIHSWNRSEHSADMKICGKIQEVSLREHYDQSHDTNGLFTIQSSVTFIDQGEECGDGHFVCYPNSHSDVHSSVTKDINEEGTKAEHIYAKAGDVILWRSDFSLCSSSTWRDD